MRGRLAWLLVGALSWFGGGGVAFAAGGDPPAAPAEPGAPPRDDPETVAQFLVCEGELAEACTAFRNGEFGTARAVFEGRAAQADAAAANNLGVLLETGLGVAASKPEALRWYRSAAGSGLAMGQYNLGVLLASDHVLGRDDPERRREDFIDAYAWILVAAHQGLEAAEATRRQLVAHMTPDEVGRARERAASRIAALPEE